MIQVLSSLGAQNEQNAAVEMLLKYRTEEDKRMALKQIRERAFAITPAAAAAARPAFYEDTYEDTYDDDDS